MKRACLGWMILVVACLGSSGCDERGPTLCQPGGEGRIEGVVRTGGVPFDSWVVATRITDVPGDASSFETTTSTDGSYAIDVPAGRYVVSLFTEYSAYYDYSVDGLRFGNAPPDTLQIDAQHSPVSIDFDLAGLRAHVELSPQLDGTTASIRLHRRGPLSMDPYRSYVRSTGGEVRGGVLDVTLGAVLPGSYRVEVLLGDYLSRTSFWIPGVRDSAESPWIQVHADSALEVTGRLAIEPARIQGRIHGAWLEFGIRPPSISIFDADSNLVQSQAWVGDDGRFDRTIFAPAAVKLLVRHEDINQWIGGQSFADATLFQLEPGRTISGIEFVQCGMFVEVSLPFPYGAGARFNLYDAVTMSLVARWFDDLDFVLAIPNLRPGTYRMQIRPSSPGRTPWVPQWHDRVTDPAMARTITIGQPGEIVRVPLVLEKGGTIAGVVREVPGVTTGSTIYITPADTPANWGFVFTSAEERTFLLAGLPDGDWKIGALRHSFEGPALETVWYPGTTDWQAAEVITMRGYEDITGIEIVIPVVP